MWWIDGDGVAQRILNVPIGGDLTWISELSLTGQNSSIWFFVCLSWFFTSESTIFQSWVYLGGSSTKAAGKTLTLTSLSLKIATHLLSHCAPHRHGRLRQTLSIITFILLDILLLINKKRHADNNDLHVWILKRNASFRRFFWVPKINTNEFFFQHSQSYLAYRYIQSLESNNQPIKSRLLVNPEARFLVLGTCSCSYSSLRWSCFLVIWRRKQSLQSIVLVIVFRATSNNGQSWCNMRNIPGRRQSIFDLRLSIVLTFSIAA